jgi:hypothetical protein
VLPHVAKNFPPNFAPILLEAILTTRDGIESKDKETLIVSLNRMI